MLRKIMVSCMFFVFMIAIGTTLAAGEDIKNEEFTTPELEKFLLSKPEISGNSLEYQHKHHWFIGMKEGKTQEKIGVEQSWVSSSRVHTYVRYCTFNSHQEALDAATFHISNVAWIFKEGSFTGLPVGDKSWISVQSHGAAIMVVRGNQIVSVGSPDCNEKGREELEKIAQKIVKKIDTDLKK